jgi:multiple sugar transport system substrate-binding protein
MNSTRRKSIACAAIIGILPTAAAVAACGPGREESSTRPTGKDIEGVVQPLVRNNQLERDLQLQAFALFQERYPKIKVDAVDAGAGYDDKTQTLLAAGTPPSLWFAGQNVGFRNWAAKGAIENLDPLIARDKYDLKQFYERYLPFHKFNGKYMALPRGELPWILFYNRALFDQAGIKYPTKDWNDKAWTWDRFLDLGRSLTKSEGGKVSQFGVGAVGAAPRFTAMMFGGDWFPEEGYESGWIRRYTGSSQEVVEAYQYQADLQHRSHVQPTPAELREMGLSIANAFAAGKIAMHAGHVGFFPTLAKVQDLKWGMAAIPIGPGRPRRTLMWSDYWSFFAGQKSPDAAWELLKFMLGADAQKLFQVGIGSMSGLKSLAAYWTETNQNGFGVSAEELKVAEQGVEVAHVSADNFTVNWPDLWEALKGPVDQVLSGSVPARQALTEVTPAADAVIKATVPKA